MKVNYYCLSLKKYRQERFLITKRESFDPNDISIIEFNAIDGSIFNSSQDISKKYDFIVCNGVFTLKNKLSQKEMKKFVVKCIKIFHKFSKIGFSFNRMSEVVDYKSKILFYPSRNIVIKTLKNKNISVIKQMFRFSLIISILFSMILY